ncbi:MAG: 23S rRNA pseudouridine1911/1915/1917 synthase [Candidatus Azotimanducaceae bacterium]|jgi:23S rRNA pseudouridine1911/1915/1917 synthase
MSRLRFDRVAADLFPDFSRARLQQWIQSGELTLNGQVQVPKYKVDVGAVLVLSATPETLNNVAEDIPLSILFEDEQILVLDKPDGLVVHPGAGNRDGTLLNALLHHCPRLDEIPRAGIVHRLDKRTTGLMVVAKTLQAQNYLVRELQLRQVKRIYEALVYGVIVRPGKVEAPIGRHKTQRTKMSIRDDGKEAVTRYRSLEVFERYSHVELSLQTGRTHQIRVHMQYLGFPLIGDPTYGGHFRHPPGKEQNGLVKGLLEFPRQALHARQLSFVHPASEEICEFESPLTEDMSDLLGLLRTHGRA